MGGEEGGKRGLGLLCLVDTGSSADCCLTLSSAAWLLIGPEASTSRRPSDQIQMWNESGGVGGGGRDVGPSMFHMARGGGEMGISGA